MKIITKQIENTDAFSAALSEVLYFDIETTGLSSEKSGVYLIGCAGHGAGGWNLTQWLDESGQEERELLSSFFAYAKSFRTLIHYNGDHFDIPFLAKRAQKLGLDNPLAGMASLDLYRTLLPYKSLLQLADAKQQTVEACFGTGREEHTSGKELIGVYQHYIQAKSESDLLPLLAHNEADIQGLVSLTPILALHELENAKLRVVKADLDRYNDHNGAEQTELLLTYESDRAVPRRISASFGHCYLRQEGARGLLKIPVYHETLKYFYANYKDYYYLPAEDMALHKSIASFVEASHRVQATAKTCYTKKEGTFLPQFFEIQGSDALFCEPFFQRAPQEKEYFLEWTAERKTDRDFLSAYAAHLYRTILLRNR